MAYSINPNLPKARATALQLLIQEKLSLQVVANRCGVHRSTIYRWRQKWLKINQNVQLANYDRPNRTPGVKFRFAALSWLIPTLSSRPIHSPNAVPEPVVELVLRLRRLLKRCAEVIWHHLISDNGVTISLSSVRRILKRHQYINGRRKQVRPSNPIRPLVTKPGELIQADTIHYVCPYTKRRRYVYTVIDLYSRMAYAEVHGHIRPGMAAKAILRAMEQFGYSFNMVQTDNGLEYGHYFERVLKKHTDAVKHSRLGRPNDNAHIERFNRTIQDGCLGRYLDHKATNSQIQSRINKYLEFYNQKRVHLGLQLRTPAEMLQSS